MIGKKKSRVFMTDIVFPEEEEKEAYPYLWDTHMKTGRELDHLDRMERRLHGNVVDNEILHELILPGPYGSQPGSDVSQVDGNVLKDYMVTRLRRLTGLLERQVSLTRIRADMVERSTEALIAFFPEKKFQPGLERMADTAELHVRDLAERLKSIRHVMSSDSSDDLGEEDLVQQARTISGLRQEFRNSNGYDDPASVAERTPLLEAEYHRLSCKVLQQALVQKKIARECLSIVATDMTLRECFNMKCNADPAPSAPTSDSNAAWCVLPLRESVNVATRASKSTFDNPRSK